MIRLDFTEPALLLMCLQEEIRKLPFSFLSGNSPQEIPALEILESENGSGQRALSPSFTPLIHTCSGCFSRTGT